MNVWPSSAGVAWPKAPIFWFGKATENDNYVDVRVAYDSQNLYVYATVVDYYLWWNQNGIGDPRQSDAVGLYLSAGPSGTSPSPTDYAFVSAYRWWPAGNDPRWHLQARGNGSNWDFNWSPATLWTDNAGARWYNSGPNNNSDKDAGWTTTLTIPWSTLGLSGPPAAGSTWNLGLKLFDRDVALPAPMQPNTTWPAGVADTSPASWGTIAFDPPAYSPAVGQATGTTTLRGGLTAVKDGYVGGGGTCGGGIFGGGDTSHPGTENLFVQNQSDIADFPCFSRSYFWFDTSRIPTGKKIFSASLTIYEFGGSDPTQAQPSLVQLMSVSDDWDPATLTWNNSPMAHENLSSTMLPVLQTFPGWPGVANTWDATQAVSEAYAEGKAVNIALYSADTAYHSGKYFTSSSVGDWDAAGRPTVNITWGD